MATSEMRNFRAGGIEKLRGFDRASTSAAGGRTRWRVRTMRVVRLRCDD